MALSPVIIDVDLLWSLPKPSGTIAPHPPYGISVLYPQQKSGSGIRIHGNHAQLWSDFFRSSHQVINVPTDILAFFVVIAFARSRTPQGSKMSRILQKIVEDSTIYFLVIFTSHFVLEMSLLFARVSRDPRLPR